MLIARSRDPSSPLHAAMPFLLALLAFSPGRGVAPPLPPSSRLPLRSFLPPILSQPDRDLPASNHKPSFRRVRLFTDPDEVSGGRAARERGGGRGGRGVGGGRGARQGRGGRGGLTGSRPRSSSAGEVVVKPLPPLSLPPAVMARLEACGIAQLNPLQQATNALALRRLDLIVHAETGSGKTLCFALPTLAMVEEGEGEGEGERREAAPRVLVLAPTLELSLQTAHVYNTLLPGCAEAVEREATELPRSRVVCGPPAILLRLLSEPSRPQAGKLGGSSTPPRLRGPAVSLLKAVVLDEADALLMTLGRYATFREKSSRVSHPKEAATLVSLLCAARGHELQVIAASATVGRPMRRELASLCDRSLELVRAPPPPPLEAAGGEGRGLGEASRAPREKARPVGLPAGLAVSVLTYEPENVIAALHDVLNKEDAVAPLLFLPAGRSLQMELQLLNECGLNAITLADALSHLRTESNPLGSSNPEESERQRLIVASSSEARGIDLPGVDLVILMGIPPSADSFLHLAGRTARRGESGKVVVLSTEKSAARQLSTLGSQLGIDFASSTSHLPGVDEKWANTWRVHEKVVQAEAKGWS